MGSSLSAATMKAIQRRSSGQYPLLTLYLGTSPQGLSILLIITVKANLENKICVPSGWS